MFTREKLEEVIEEGGANEYRSVFSIEPTWMPLHLVSEEFTGFKRVVGMAATMIGINNDKRIHNVSIGYDGESWYLSAGNTFLSGAIESHEKELVVAELAQSKEEEKEMDTFHCSLADEVASEHWRIWYSENRLVDEVSDFLVTHVTPKILDAIENKFHGQIKKDETEEELIAARMQLYAFKRHLLFIGEKGSGKTHDIYAYMKKEGLPHVFVGGNADVEAMDLKGNLLPYEKNGEKNFIWVDGPLTQAFRRAATGEKVVLFIDELLRMSKSAQSLLVPALTTDNDGNYVLDTGRVIDVVEGVGKTECIKAPSKNLWVLGTTNMGAEYGTPDMESALEDRFELIEKNNDIEKIRRVLTEITQDKSFDASVVDGLVNFYTSMVLLKEEGILAKLINLRHLAQSLQDSKSKNDLYDCLMDRVPKWVERDMGGKLLDEQIEVVKKALRKAGMR